MSAARGTARRDADLGLVADGVHEERPHGGVDELACEVGDDVGGQARLALLHVHLAPKHEAQVVGHLVKSVSEAPFDLFLPPRRIRADLQDHVVELGHPGPTSVTAARARVRARTKVRCASRCPGAPCSARVEHAHRCLA